MALLTKQNCFDEFNTEEKKSNNSINAEHQLEIFQISILECKILHEKDVIELQENKLNMPREILISNSCNILYQSLFSIKTDINEYESKIKGYPNEDWKENLVKDVNELVYRISHKMVEMYRNVRE
jgi:hypothetical protein